jgi:hypothetical protein
MNLETMRSGIVRHRGALLVVTVVGLGAVATAMAIGVAGQARELAAGIGASAEPSVIPTPSEAPPSHHHTEQPSTPEPTVVATPDPTADPTPVATPEPAAPWVLAGSFDADDGPTGVMDVTVWNETAIAIGTSWVVSTPSPRLWSSVDGRSWSDVPIDLGPGVSPQVVAPLPDGRLMILGTVGGRVEYWSDPERAAAWTSGDGSTWTPIALPFGDQAQPGPVGFAAGAEGLIATTADDIWHSADGVAWHHVYDAPRGTSVYEPVAGDEGWIVRRSNASLWTTTLLVSGDAVTWHEVDLEHVASVANIGGDWLVSRPTADWDSSEVLRSEDGLDWTVVLDLENLAPPDGADPGLADAPLVGASLSGTGGTYFLSPWQAGHCGSMPGGGWGTWWSTDGATWHAAGIGGDAVVTHAVELADATVLAGYTAATGEVAFWVSRP